MKSVLKLKKLLLEMSDEDCLFLTKILKQNNNMRIKVDFLNEVNSVAERLEEAKELRSKR